MDGNDPFDDLRRLLDEFTGAGDRDPTQFGPGRDFDFEEMLEELNTDFDDQLGGQFGQDDSGFSVDVVDNGEEFVVVADLPGYGRENVDVTLVDNTLHISAERETEFEESGDNFVRHERSSEAVSRSLSLPDTVEQDGVEAEYNNGVLRVTLPQETVDDGHEIEIE